MEPLSPQDPIKHLLAQAREVEVRPNFTQNVLRAARQTPQDRGWLAGLRAVAARAQVWEEPRVVSAAVGPGPVAL